ncbi:hypothetical protein NXS19_005859 [Fusarium pseudograminearum]|nr:hypothetical protein NXS19_005859 [Fusarium pseudograminearum]
MLLTQSHVLCPIIFIYSSFSYAAYTIHSALLSPKTIFNQKSMNQRKLMPRIHQLPTGRQLIHEKNKRGKVDACEMSWPLLNATLRRIACKSLDIAFSLLPHETRSLQPVFIQPRVTTYSPAIEQSLGPIVYEQS